MHVERFSLIDQSAVISSILKHDRKHNNYKIALVRAINDVLLLSYPNIKNFGADVAIPLRALAEFWLAYYWPFADSGRPLLQGVKPPARSNMSFRQSLTTFRDLWQTATGLQARPADGFFIINEFCVPRRRDSYDSGLLRAYRTSITEMANAIRGANLTE